MWLAEVIIFIYLFFAIFKKLMGKLNSTQVHMDPDILFTYNPVLHPISTQLYPVLRLGAPTPPHFQLPSNTSPTGTKTLTLSAGLALFIPQLLKLNFFFDTFGGL